jgi:hypothetical protein
MSPAIPASQQGRSFAEEVKPLEQFIKEKIMSKPQDNRVLSRQLARDLTPQEIETITGGFFTNPYRDATTTFCTLASDGDDD